MKAAYARSAAERRIEAALGFAAIYALGPADGPEMDRLKIGVAASERALAKELKDAQVYSSRILTVRVLRWCMGKPVAFRLKAEVEARLRAENRRLRGSWYQVGADEMVELMTSAALEIGAELFDDAGRKRRVLDALEREMERALKT